MGDAQLAEIRARAEAATEGPWYVVGPPWNEAAPFINAVSEDPHAGEVVCDFTYTNYDADHRETNNSEANAAFIASARSDVPALLAEVKRLRGCISWMNGDWSAEQVDFFLARYDAARAGSAPADTESGT